MASTIHVIDQYVLKKGEELHFKDQPAFELDGGSGGDAPYLAINGAALVISTSPSGQAVGVDDESDQGLVDIGRQGSLIVTGGAGAIGVRLDYAELDNAGQIHAEISDLGGAAFGVQMAEDFGVATNSGTISVSGGFWAYGVWGGAVVHNSGVIEVTAPLGNSFGSAVDTYLLENSGRVEMSGGVATGAVASYLTNTGLIRSEGPNDATAVVLEAGGSLENDGRIVARAGDGQSFGLFIQSFGVESPTSITNTGLIASDIGYGRIPQGPALIDNSGRILGSIQLGWGDDQLHDSGLIRGEVQLLDGDDVFQVQGSGRITGPIHGDGGDDLLIGGRHAEALLGDGREDQSETPGADTLQGNGGADTLTGGAAADVFVYASISDSTAAHRDLITDLATKDRIDLSQIDADAAKVGDQAFHLVKAFTHHAGELLLSYSAGPDVTTLAADVDGDATPDLVIELSGNHQNFTDFVL